MNESITLDYEYELLYFLLTGITRNKDLLQNMMLIPIVSRVIQNEENDEVVI